LFSRGSAEPSGEPPLRQGNGALDGKGRVSLFWNVEEFKDEFNEHLRGWAQGAGPFGAGGRSPPVQAWAMVSSKTLTDLHVGGSR
jgi:hypothetical protein